MEKENKTTKQQIKNNYVLIILIIVMIWLGQQLITQKLEIGTKCKQAMYETLDEGCEICWAKKVKDQNITYLRGQITLITK